MCFFILSHFILKCLFGSGAKKQMKAVFQISRDSIKNHK